ncbi:MAG: adenosylcobinamide-GDP ribazoletransferase [Pseudomonadota bacterium]
MKSGRVMEIAAALANAIQFLSRLPVYRTPYLPQPIHDSLRASPDFSKTATFFPIAGLVIALPAAFTLMMLGTFGAPATLTAIITLAVLTLTTGALHEDGLADVADGFWGGHTLERKLAIMRDSAIGTYGTLALVFSIAVRISCLTALIDLYPVSWAAGIVMAVAGLSRAAMLIPWSQLPAARPTEKRSENTSENTSPNTTSKQTSGLSARYGTPDSNTVRLAMLWSIAPTLILLSVAGLITTVLTLTVLLALVWATKIFMRHHIGGHTGDTLGATQQTGEMGCFLTLVMTMSAA